MLFEQILFFLSAALTIGSAVMVVVTKNIMHACVYLLGSLIGVSGLYVTLGADFVAAVQFMVYVGGVTILMLFAVMLTGGPDSENNRSKLLFLSPIMGSKKSYIFGGFTAVVFFASIYGIVKNVWSFSKIKSNPSAFEPTVEKIGTLLVTDHVLSFEFASILLLGALIGAAIIARPKVLRIGVKKD